MHNILHKPFDNGLFDEFDSPARQAAQALLRERNIDCMENPDPYGVDLIMPSKNRGLEVEVKTHWKNGQKRFPFDTVNVLHRKKALLSGPNTLLILSNDLKGGLLARGEKLVTYMTGEPKSLLVKINGEQFYDFVYEIPLEAFQYIIIPN